MISSDTEPIALSARRQKGARFRIIIALVTCAAVITGAVAVVSWAPWRSAPPPQPVRYLGVAEPDAPGSYAGVNQFAHAIGMQPNLVVYYTPWRDPFQASFATSAAAHGAVTLIQLAPRKVSLASIAAGQSDPYLRAYAAAVKKFGKKIVLSFGHEMNGSWYTWGYQHTSPAVFVAAWRHIVTVFRAAGADNVTWLWTVNAIHKKNNVPAPGPWWPGNSYVNWIGVDGYFTSSSSVFATVFGPTIVYLRSLSHDPILITETSATPAASQPTKIADLFAGVRLYGLLGFVWFDSFDKVDWRLTSPAAIAAFRRGAAAYQRPAS